MELSCLGWVGLISTTRYTLLLCWHCWRNGKYAYLLPFVRYVCLANVGKVEHLVDLPDCLIGFLITAEATELFTPRWREVPVERARSLAWSVVRSVGKQKTVIFIIAVLHRRQRLTKKPIINRYDCRMESYQPKQASSFSSSSSPAQHIRPSF